MAKAKEPPKNPVSPEAAALFDERMRFWQTALNLRDWRVIKSGKKTSAMAEISEFLHTDRIARYRLGADFGEHPVNGETIDATACHEMLHVRLFRLMAAVADHGWESEEALAAEHEVIIVLEPILCAWARLAELAGMPPSSTLREPIKRGA